MIKQAALNNSNYIAIKLFQDLQSLCLHVYSQIMFTLISDLTNFSCEKRRRVYSTLLWFLRGKKCKIITAKHVTSKLLNKVNLKWGEGLITNGSKFVIIKELKLEWRVH